MWGIEERAALERAAAPVDVVFLSPMNAAMTWRMHSRSLDATTIKSRSPTTASSMPGSAEASVSASRCYPRNASVSRWS